MTVDDILDHILDEEGAVQNDDADKDGPLPTNWGITADTLALDRGHAVTAAEIVALTRAEAKEILRRQFVLKFALEENVLDVRMLWLVLDCAVNNGPENAFKFMQRALKIEDDGIFGPVTRDAVARAIRLGGLPQLFRATLRERMLKFARIIAHDPSQARFAPGWFGRRVAPFIEMAP